MLNRSFDFLLSPATQLVEKLAASGQASTVQDAKGFLLSVLSQLEQIEWTAVLKGCSVALFSSRRGNNETFVVDERWQPDEDQLSQYQTGPEWPSRYQWGGLEREPNLLVVRRCGRGSKYLQSALEQLNVLDRIKSVDFDPLRKMIEEGVTSNARPHRDRTRRLAPSGALISGIEVCQRETFIVRTEGEPHRPIAAFVVALSAFFPTQSSIADIDRVPILTLSILDSCLEPYQTWSPNLVTAVSNMIVMLTQQALFNVGPDLANSAFPYQEGYDEIPFVIRVRLKPEMSRLVNPVFTTFLSLGSDTDHPVPLIDSNTTLISIDVCANSDPADSFEKDKEAAANRSLIREQRRAEVDAGDEYVLTQFDVSCFCIGKDGLLFPSHYLETYDALRKDLQYRPRQTLAEYDLVPEDLIKVPLASERLALIRKAVVDREEEHDLVDAFTDDLHAAVLISLFGPFSKCHLLMRVLVDSATKAQCVCLLSQDQPFEKFLDHSVEPLREGLSNEYLVAASRRELPAELPHLTFGHPPKSIKVPRSLLPKHPDIAKWCERRGVELIHPKSGFEVSTFARLWKEDIRSATFIARERGMKLDELQAFALRLCWTLNEVPPISYGYRGMEPSSGQSGANVDRYRAHRDGVNMAR